MQINEPMSAALTEPGIRKVTKISVDQAGLLVKETVALEKPLRILRVPGWVWRVSGDANVAREVDAAHLHGTLGDFDPLPPLTPPSHPPQPAAIS